MLCSCDYHRHENCYGVKEDNGGEGYARYDRKSFLTLVDLDKVGVDCKKIMSDELWFAINLLKILLNLNKVKKKKIIKMSKHKSDDFKCQFNFCQHQNLFLK